MSNFEAEKIRLCAILKRKMTPGACRSIANLAWHGDGKRERLIFFVWLLFYIVCKLYFEEVRKDIALVSRRMDVSRRTAA